jgi:hypothetical protein
MKLLLILGAFSLLGLGCRPAANDSAHTYYLQLVRGNDRDVPPTPDAKPIGPKLSERLRSVFKWKYYWELKRDSAVVRQGQTIRRRMSPQRDVEIELLNPQRMAVRIYQNGRLSRSRNQPAKAAFCVASGKSGPDQSWFLVVRDDRPLDPVTEP